VAKTDKQPKLLGPSTVAKPCIIGAGVLLVIQTAMRVLLKA
jgi:hypothetical protein